MRIDLYQMGSISSIMILTYGKGSQIALGAANSEFSLNKSAEELLESRIHFLNFEENIFPSPILGWQTAGNKVELESVT